MSLKYLMILVLAGAATAGCASVPQGQPDTSPSAGATCQVKSEQAVASCGAPPTAEEAQKASEEQVASRANRLLDREPFHHRGRMGD